MNADQLIVNICWTVFVVVWFAAALFTKRAVERQSPFSRAALIAATFFGVWLLVSNELPFDLNAMALPRTPAVQGIGAALAILGLGFTLWARFTLGRNWSGAVTFKENHELIQRGPYALVRHPIYSGFLTLFLGSVFVVGTRAGVAAFVIVLVGLWLKLRQEERMLTKHFPDVYPGYRARVKALVPFLF